jgi:3-hydroxybutyryl-CoA dehydrogenase
MKRIVLTGDPALVEEYAHLCSERGLEVGVLSAGKVTKSRRGSPAARGIRNITRPPRATDLAIELTLVDMDAKQHRLASLGKTLPEHTPILTAATTVSVTDQNLWLAHPERLVGLGALPSLLRGSLIELSRSAITSDAAFDVAREFAGHIGRETALVADQVGMVLPRILCMLSNEAFFALGEGVATAKDIDTAMMLGTNYPRGPLDWAGIIGPENVLAVLSALHGVYGDDRYRPSPLLRRHAAESRSR